MRGGEKGRGGEGEGGGGGGGEGERVDERKGEEIGRKRGREERWRVESHK